MTNQSHTELAAHMALVSEYAKACNNAMSEGTVKFAEAAWLAVEASARNLASLESPERVQGEPVAYAVMLPSGRVSRTRNTAERAQRHVDDWNRRYPKPPHAYVAPLGVLSATPSPQAEKQPLSDEQHRAIWERESRDWAEGRNDNPYLAYGQAVERAHGIVTKESTNE